MKQLLPLLALALATKPALAQVPPGQTAQFAVNPTLEQMIGLELVDAPGTQATTTVGGMSPFFAEFRDGILDPVSGKLWVAGYAGSAGLRVYRLTLAGSDYQGAEEIADLFPVGASSLLRGLALDRDGNLFVCDRESIFRIDRADLSATKWLTQAPPHYEFTDLTIDRETNTLWTVSTTQLGSYGGFVRQFDVDAGPASVVDLIEPALFGLPEKGMSITHDENGVLYVGAEDGLWSYDTTTAQALALPVAGVPNDFVSLDHDAQLGLLHTGGGGLGQGIYSLIDPLAPGGPTATVVNRDHFCPGAPSSCPEVPFWVTAVAVNDFLHTTEVFPRTASASTGFLLEAAAHGHPGEPAAVAVTEVNGVPIPPLFLGGLGGACDPGGSFVVSQPVGALPGSVTSIGIETGVLDSATGQWVLGGVRTVALTP